MQVLDACVRLAAEGHSARGPRWHKRSLYRISTDAVWRVALVGTGKPMDELRIHGDVSSGVAG